MKYTWWGWNVRGAWTGNFLLCGGGYIHGQKIPVHWDNSILQRMLLVLKNRQSSQEQLLSLQRWSKAKKVFQALFHTNIDRTYCAVCYDSTVNDFTALGIHLFLPNAKSPWAPTVCSGLSSSREERDFEKSLSSKGTLSGKKMLVIKYV